ncbi:MAG TPA: kelch repeat-containing protein [Fimbriimonadaceae bacterium]|nr:kelch repeat-containing protein [Fimbriimonadaceae bacterium]
MEKTPQTQPAQAQISRRDLMRGAAAAAIMAGTSARFASARGLRPIQQAQTTSTAPIMRYMAAAAALGDGRVLVTGGYDRQFSDTDTPSALCSAVVYDSYTGKTSVAAPMSIPRARHAAVSLKDGRVAVVGGISSQPTASIEIYDPGTNSWTSTRPLAQPRYDHVAAYDGDAIIVIGGSSVAMLTGVEAVYPG